MAKKLTQSGGKLALLAAGMLGLGATVWGMSDKEYSDTDARMKGECGLTDPDGVHNHVTGPVTEDIRRTIGEKAFSISPFDEFEKIGSCLEALKTDDGVITPKEEELLQIWAEIYIENLFRNGKFRSDIKNPGVTKEALQALSAYLIATIAHSPNSAQQIAALERFYDVSHATWILGPDTPEWDMSEFEKPGSVMESDAGLLSQLLADMVIRVRDGYVSSDSSSENKEAYNKYVKALEYLEQGIRNIDFGFAQKNHQKAAKDLHLDGLRLGTLETDPRKQLFELMQKFHDDGNMTTSELEDANPTPLIGRIFEGIGSASSGAVELYGDTMQELSKILVNWNEKGLAGLGESTRNAFMKQMLHIRPYKEVLYNLCEQEPDSLGVFFSKMIDMTPEEAASYFNTQILGNRALMTRNAATAWLPDGSDTKLAYEAGIEWGNFDPAKNLDIALTLELLELNPDTIKTMVLEYQTNRESIEKRPNGKTIAEATWGKDPDSIRGAVETWVVSNLGGKFKATPTSDKYASLDEVAAYSTRHVSPWVGFPLELGKGYIDYTAMMEAKNGLNMVDSTEATAVTAFNTGEELSRFWAAANIFSTKGTLIFGGAGTVGNGFLMKVFAPLEAADLWFDPQLDPDLGMTTRHDRGEELLDSWSEKFRFYILLPLMTIGYFRRKKWAETTYMKRFLTTGPRVAAGVDFGFKLAKGTLKAVANGVRGGVKGILAIPSTVRGMIENHGIDQDELEGALNEDVSDDSDQFEASTTDKANDERTPREPEKQ
ncbi:MAG: hypothetical protein Q8P68_03540 [Candidatus Peregrinibacteria bacterium]|nr:hypothetical protein [Candidatus Peregrinibacteria bacterium]MDZ4245326.1 hypothetical protein [Candidatus Gracilibacteria bacterium]